MYYGAFGHLRGFQGGFTKNSDFPQRSKISHILKFQTCLNYKHNQTCIFQKFANLVLKNINLNSMKNIKIQNSAEWKRDIPSFVSEINQQNTNQYESV